MNKLTKELAEQAAGNFTQNFKWEHLQQIDKDIFEKFAELVVRECAKVLTQHGTYFSGDGKPYIYAAGLIEEHFGVKE